MERGSRATVGRPSPQVAKPGLVPGVFRTSTGRRRRARPDRAWAAHVDARNKSGHDEGAGGRAKHDGGGWAAILYRSAPNKDYDTGPVEPEDAMPRQTPITHRVATLFPVPDPIEEPERRAAPKEAASPIREGPKVLPGQLAFDLGLTEETPSSTRRCIP